MADSFNPETVEGVPSCPKVGAYVVLTVDPAASVQHLEDPVATEAASQICFQPHVGCVVGVRSPFILIIRIVTHLCRGRVSFCIMNHTTTTTLLQSFHIFRKPFQRNISTKTCPFLSCPPQTTHLGDRRSSHPNLSRGR